MIKKLDVYKCEVCGNIIEVKHAGAPALVCCGEPMHFMEENSVDAATEKHVPIIEKTENGYKVTVGEVEHPMQESHYIEWIDLITEKMVYTKHLEPGVKPIAEFCTDAKKVYARAYCNLHGHWKSK